MNNDQVLISMLIATAEKHNETQRKIIDQLIHMIKNCKCHAGKFSVDLHEVKDN